jgi:hypothetical protein
VWLGVANRELRRPDRGVPDPARSIEESGLIGRNGGATMPASAP